VTRACSMFHPLARIAALGATVNPPGYAR